jgi:hypothetical protein
MPAEHYDRLTAVGMDWDNAFEKRVGNSYEQGFQHLEAFIAENGANSLTGSTICEDGYKLGKWYSNCKTKYRKGNLAKEHISHFEQLGVSLEKNDAWEKRYQEVKAYLEKNGGTYIPKDTYGENGHNLFSWVAEQRKADKKGKLTLEQKAKLVEIGYPFLKGRKVGKK